MLEKYAKMQGAQSVMIHVGTDGFNLYGHTFASHFLWPITLVYHSSGTCTNQYLRHNVVCWLL